MRKTLALLLAAALLYLVPAPFVSINNQTLAAAAKFQTVANPIPNRYIVVLATTDLSPIATPAATPIAVNKFAQASDTLSALSVDSSSVAFVAAPAPDPTVVATATSLTSTYGGTFSTTWSVA